MRKYGIAPGTSGAIGREPAAARELPAVELTHPHRSLTVLGALPDLRSETCGTLADGWTPRR